jgi:virginiamycin B lyase
MTRFRRQMVATAAALGVAAIAAASASAAPTATTIPLPNGFSQTEGITLGPNGAMWLADFGGQSIRQTTGGAGVGYVLPNDGPFDPTTGLGAGIDMNGPAHITTGPDGNLWFTAFNGTIGEVTTGGAITPHVITGATATANFRGITSAGGKLWYLEAEGDELRSIDTSGGAQTTEDVSALGAPEAITSGGTSDPNVYFTTLSGNIGKKNTGGGAVTPLGAVGGPANGITLGPDGHLWVTSGAAGGPGQVSKFSTTTGFVQSYTVGSVPKGITSGLDGALWFTESGGNSVGRITTNGAVSSLPLSGCSAPEDIATAADGSLWVTCFGSPALVRITEGAATPPAPTPPRGGGAAGPVAGLKASFTVKKTVIAGKVFTVKVKFNKAVTKSQVRVQIRSANTKLKGSIKKFKTIKSKLITGTQGSIPVKIAKPGLYKLRLSYKNGPKSVNTNAVKLTVKPRPRR